MPNILVVEDSAVQAKHVEMLLGQNGYQVSTEPNGEAGLSSVRKSLPDLVVTDMQMPVMNGLDLVRALRSEFPSLPVILMTSRGNEDVAVEAIRAGATGYIPKRRLDDELLPLTEELLSVSNSQRKQVLFLDKMTAIEHRFAFNTDLDLVPQVVGHIESVMKQMNLFDEAVRMRIGVAVHEAMVNGMVHGNLEIGSDLKSDDWIAYHDAIDQRKVMEPYSHRKVHVMVRAARGPYLEVRIRDEGKGFDPTKLPDPTDEANIEKGCGRGLLLIRTFFDDVSHSPSGNEIIMIRRKA